MLQVQQYLRSGKTLEDLELEHGVKNSKDISKDVVSFNYSLLSGILSPLSVECRGLILEKNTWNIIAFPFTKFYNLGEERAVPILEKFDFSNFDVYEKLDGTLIICYFYKDKWWFATRSNLIGNNVYSGCGKTYSDLVKSTIISTYGDFEGFLSYLDSNYTYMFELTTPFNVVHIQHKESSLTLIGVRSMVDCREFNLKEFQTPLKKVSFYNISSLEDIVEYVKSLNSEKSESEGVVICDKNFNRLKIKNEKYFLASSTPEHNLMSDKKKLEFILNGQLDDIEQYLPQQILEECNFIRDSINNLIKETQEEFKIINHPDKKEFTNRVKQSNIEDCLLYSLWSGKDLLEVFQKMSPNKVLQMIGKKI